jgi:DnaK suppressor protein
MTSFDTAELSRRLHEERERLVNAARYLQADSPGSMEDELGEISGGGAGDNHLGDMAAVTYDRELDQGLEEGVQLTVDRIDAALLRIDEGPYGRCEICGNPIATERLLAIPWATRCIDDARR